METKDFGKGLGQLFGAGGDEYLAAAAFTGKKFSQIVCGSNGATFTALTINGVDVVTARGYGSVSLPSGYVICAGVGEYFDSGTISVGSAQGIREYEEPKVTLESVAVDDGTAATGMTVTLTFGNTGGAGSLDVDYGIEDDEGDVVESGAARLGTAKRVYFLSGDNQTATIPGMTYPSDAGDDYVIKVRLSGAPDAAEVEDTFDVTA